MSDRILSAQEVQRIERSAFSQGVDAETLMDQAGLGIANAILGLERIPGVCLAYLGKGNNAGDALVACAALSQAGWEIWIRKHLVTFSRFQRRNCRDSSRSLLMIRSVNFMNPNRGSF